MLHDELTDCILKYCEISLRNYSRNFELLIFLLSPAAECELSFELFLAVTTTMKTKRRRVCRHDKVVNLRNERKIRSLCDVDSVRAIDSSTKLMVSRRFFYDCFASFAVDTRLSSLSHSVSLSRETFFGASRLAVFPEGSAIDDVEEM